MDIAIFALVAIVVIVAGVYVMGQRKNKNSLWLCARERRATHHHVNVVREFAFYDFETGAAFVARHLRVAVLI